MARRYGRNQKRAHRAEIAALTKELEGGWMQPRHVGREMPTIDARWVIETYDNSFYRDGYRQRKAKISIMIFDRTEKILIGMLPGDWLCYGRAAWRLTDVRIRDEAGGIIADLDLHTYAQRMG